MLVHTNRHYGRETLVLNMQTNKFGIIGTDDLKRKVIAHILGVNAEEGDEITEYLNEVIH